MQQKIIILDFGSQTTQLIGRRVRELDTFCEILPYNKFPVADESVIGVILSGSPYSVHDPQAFKVDLSQFVGKVPVLGICYGAQFIAHTNGGKVEKTNTREYGRAQLCHFDQNNPLFKDFTPNSQVWMSHGDTITQIPEGFEVIGRMLPTGLVRVGESLHLFGQSSSILRYITPSRARNSLRTSSLTSAAPVRSGVLRRSSRQR